VLDLKGKEVDGVYHEGLLADAEIEEMMEMIILRGGRVKNIFGADEKKVYYFQVSATYYSADDKKMLLVRAIVLFMPGIPQI
jgi:sucrose phosphorylase